GPRLHAASPSRQPEAAQNNKALCRGITTGDRFRLGDVFGCGVLQREPGRATVGWSVRGLVCVPSGATARTQATALDTTALARQGVSLHGCGGECAASGGVV